MLPCALKARWRGDLLIAALVLVAFANALWCGFVRDDGPQLIDNPHTQTISFAIFTVDLWQGTEGALGFFQPSGLYRPLMQLTAAVQLALHGPNPALFHLFNILLHLGVALLMRRLALRLGAGERTALFGACLFAVLPIHVEAVTGIVGRSELLSALFGLAAVFVWLGPKPQTRLCAARITAATFLYLAALLSKESAISFFALIVLADIQRGEYLEPRLKRSVILLIALVPYFWLRSRVYWGDPLFRPVVDLLDNPLTDASFIERLFAAPALLGKYLELTVAPFALASDYSFNALPVSPPPSGLLAWTVFFAALWFTAVFMAPRTRRALITGMVGFLASVSLILSWPILSSTILGERLFYTATIFLCLWGGSAIAWLWRRSEVMGLIVLALLLIAGAGRTALRNLDWRDDLTLAAADVIAVPDSARAQANHAANLLTLTRESGENQLDTARIAAQRAIAIYPEYQHAHMVLVEIFLDAGHWTAAQEALENGMPHLNEEDIAHYRREIDAQR